MYFVLPTGGCPDLWSNGNPVRLRDKCPTRRNQKNTSEKHLCRGSSVEVGEDLLCFVVCAAIVQLLYHIPRYDRCLFFSLLIVAMMMTFTLALSFLATCKLVSGEFSM
jgi:hypothetical protein